MKLRSLAFFTLCVLLAVPGAAETPPDPFTVAPFLTARVPPFGEEAKYLTKVLRPPYALEFPFHAVIDELRTPLAEHNAEHPEANVSAVIVGHGGYLLESGLPHEMAGNEPVLFMNVWLGRGAVRPPFSFGIRPGQRPATRINLDPYAGNAFVAGLEGTILDLVVIDAGGEPLTRIRLDLVSPVPLVDRTGVPHAELEVQEDGGGFFWFDVERLAPFVDLYRRSGGEEYARFVADAFLADWMQIWNDEWPAAVDMKLPYLPSAAHRPPADADAIRRLEGLRTGHYWQFVPGKPRKGGVHRPLVPLLKLLEARDCLGERDDQPLPGSCPSYSVMALQTEFYRAFPEFSEASGRALWDAFDVICDRGVCSEHLYPIPDGKALGWPGTLDEFARRSEKALNRILRRGDSVDAAMAGFLEAAGGRRIEFVDALPPLCADEMRRYVEQHDLVGHDLVELYAAQHEIGRALPESDTETLREAQRAELLHLMLRLLDAGIPVIVAVDGDVPGRRAVLAYGRTESGVVVMDGSIEDEAARRRTVIPFAELQDSLFGIAFLRGEVGQSDPTEAQLRRSLEHAPDHAWTHYRLGRVLQGADRHRAAVVALRRSVELDPDEAHVWNDLGRSLSAIARFDESVEAFDEAIHLGHDTAYCHESRGYALRKLGRFDAAATAFRRALTLDPDRTWATRQIGWTFHDAGDDLEAEAWFRKALELRPDLVYQYSDFASFLSCVGRCDEARLVLLAAAEISTESWEFDVIGSAFLRCGYPTEAITALNRAINLEEDDAAEFRLSIARVYLALGDTDELVSTLRPVEERLSSLASSGTLDVGGWIDLAYARAMLGEREACRESIDAFLRVCGEPDGGDLYEVACINALNGDPERALDALERALELGYHHYHWVRHDPDLHELFEDPRFEALLDRYAPHER